MAEDVFVVLAVLLARAYFTESLFSPSDMTILTSDNVYSKLQGSDKFWFVNFYNSWCGHCINFSPHWTGFAKNVKAWDSVINIGALDCSDQSGTVVCRDFDIYEVPSLQFFSPHSQSKNGEEATHGWTADELRHVVIDYLSKKAENGYDHLRPLLPIKSSGDILRIRSIGHRVIIVENEGSYLGREVILDTWSYDNLILRRLYAKDVMMNEMETVPGSYLMKNNGSIIPIDSDGTGRREFVEVLGSLLNLPAEEPLYPPIYDIETDEGVPYHSPDGVYLGDLLSAVRYSLLHEVAIHRTIDGVRYDALLNYSQVLVKYFPGPENTMIYLNRINEWLLQTQPPLDGETWTETLHNLQDSDAYLPDSEVYVGCLGSEPHFRGFPCSMWVLFHTLTVNAVIDHGFDVGYDPQEVMLAMRGYITQFFGCQECSKNFNKGAVYIEERVKTPDDGILFLWQSHNKANFRLQGEITEDPRHPKVQFPPKRLCAQCQMNASPNENGTINWETTQVLHFLKKMYSKRHIMDSYSSGLGQNTACKQESYINSILFMIVQIILWKVY